jgi:hypothetical protein
MSSKCRHTAAVISTVRSVTPRQAQSRSALERVREVVPKQGMVTATASVRGRFSMSIARTVTSRARQESSPPEMPTTAVFAREWLSRFMRPLDWMVRIVSQRASLSVTLSGTKAASGQDG